MHTDLGPALIGVVTACGGVGGLIGAALAGRTAHRLGTGPVIVGGSLVFNLAGFLTPLAALTAVHLPLLIAGQVFSSVGYTVYQINQLSLRQVVTPARLLGRVTAARRFLIFSMAPIGAAFGGFLGSGAGFAPTLVVGAAVSVIATLLLLFSPVRRVRSLTTVL